MTSKINKVDMSLDDIIKLNKKNKTGVSPLNRSKSGPGINKGNGYAVNNLNRARRRTTNSGRIEQNNINTDIQKKRLAALKRLREAKQTLALLDGKKTARPNVINQQQGFQNQQRNRQQQQQQRRYTNTQNDQQNPKPRSNLNYGNNIQQIQIPQNKRQNLKRKFISTLSPSIQENTRRTNKINRQYENQVSFSQLDSPNKKLKNIFYNASNMSLASIGFSSSINQSASTRRQRGKRRQNVSFDDNLTVSVSNIKNNNINSNNIRKRQRQNRNKKLKKVNLTVQKDKHRDYEFDAHVFSNIGTTVPLSQRFSSRAGQGFKSQNTGRQVFF